MKSKKWVRDKNIIFISFESDEYAHLITVSNWMKLPRKQENLKGKIYLFFDEIQQE